MDLSTIEPSIAGPKRPQDRIPLSRAPQVVGALLDGHGDRPKAVPQAGVDEASRESFPASDSPAVEHQHPGDQPAQRDGLGDGRGTDDWPSHPVPVALADGTETTVDDGHVVIAAITSCTNTSNPSVMLGAGLLAKKAVERGLVPQPWVKTSLAPGSRVVTDYCEAAGYYEAAGLTPYLAELGFDLVGYGCTACIGNSGPLIPEVSAAVTEHDLSVCSVLSGNRNFRTCGTSSGRAR